MTENSTSQPLVQNGRVSRLCDGFALFALAAVLASAGVIYLRPDLAPWPLLTAPAFWLLRMVVLPRECKQGRALWSLSGLMLVFILTAAVGLWASYDRTLGLTDFGPAGLYKFWLLVAAALVFDAAARLPSARSVWAATAGFASIGALAAAYFLLTNDFSDPQPKFLLLNRMGLLVQSLRPEFGLVTPGRTLHPNVAGGLSAAALPAFLHLSWFAWQSRPKSLSRYLFLAASVLGIILAGFGLILSSSRGAWIGLAVVLTCWCAWWLAGRLGLGLMKRVGLFMVGGVAAAAALALLFPRIMSWFPPLFSGESTLVTRIDLMRDSLLLAQAAPFTGTGLGTFPSVFSTYVLLIHTPILSHAHNVYLNLFISQGIGGLLAYLGLVAAALLLAYKVARRSEEKWPLAGAVAMIGVGLVHGLIDDPFYGSRAVLVWFAPFGLIAAAARAEGVDLRWETSQRSRIAVFGVGLAAIILAAAWFRGDLLASYEANLGLVRQAQAELVRYDPDRLSEQTLDQVRAAADLTKAEAHYAQALRYNPNQRTANLQLAGIALARGQYDLALVQSERAWNAGNRDRVTRMMYGVTLVAQGRPQEAAGVLRGVSWAESRLNGEAWYRYYRFGDYPRAAAAYRAMLLLNPNDETAKQGLAQSEMHIP